MNTHCRAFLDVDSPSILVVTIPVKPLRFFRCRDQWATPMAIADALKHPNPHLPELWLCCTQPTPVGFDGSNYSRYTQTICLQYW